MKSRGFLTALCVVSLIGIFVFGITPMVYAKAAPDATDADGVQAKVEGQMPATGNVNPDAKGPDKGSPMHGGIAIIRYSGLEVGATFSKDKFTGWRRESRNSSASTIGYELQSLV